MATEKYWSDCSQEEKDKIRELSRLHRMLNFLHNSGKVSDWKYKKFVRQEKRILDFLEWFYSDEETDRRDYANWKDSFDRYQETRKDLL